jgi:hypothetical protein
MPRKRLSARSGTTAVSSRTLRSDSVAFSPLATPVKARWYAHNRYTAARITPTAEITA